MIFAAFKKGHSDGHNEGYDKGKSDGLSLGKKAFLLGLPAAIVAVIAQGVGKDVAARTSDSIGLTDIITNWFASIGVTDMLSSWLASIMSFL